jgi:unsaturated rhamnogalacturonyl hydrolase
MMVHRRLSVLALTFITLSCFAQSKLVPPGDTPATAGPLAHLSPKLSRRHVGKAMKLVADWQLSRMPAQPQTDWTFAALYTGFMAVPEKIGGDKYRQAMLNLGNGLNWQPGPRVLHADDQAVGQMYMEQYFLHQSVNGYVKMMVPMKTRLDTEIAVPESDYATVLPRNWDKARYSNLPLWPRTWVKTRYPNTPLWWWCDALFMAPPVYADMFHATGDSKYIDFMDRQWGATTDLLYDRTEHLYSRDATFLDKHEKNGRKIFWSRGNGWVMGGIVRVLQQLPPDSPLRPKYVALLKEMAAATLAVQGTDGLWRPGLLEPDSYPLPEISGSGFITYAYAWGVNQGILDRATYWPAVQKAWAGMLSHVYADGRLGCIQPVGAAPGAFTETSSYVYGVGAYLLAGSEIYKSVK